MICYKGRTFCASPGCKNKCGRQFTHADQVAAERAGLPVSMAYFCGEPEKEKGE